MTMSKKCTTTVPGVGGDGNSESPPTQYKDNALYRWFFTFKCDLFRDVDHLIEVLKPKCQKYLFQSERGEETGFLHYQGQMTLAKRQRMKGVLRWLPKGCHIEPTRNEEACWKYVCKEETRVEGPWEYEQQKEEESEIELDEPSKPFHREILRLLETKADKRSIWWYWKNEGKQRKTTFAKYICVKYKRALYVNGKERDILHGVAETKPKIVIIDIQRDQKIIPYSAMEAVKNGIFYTGKYESKQVIMNCPHIIVFANREPDYGKLSEDRWIVREIED